MTKCIHRWLRGFLEKMQAIYRTFVSRSMPILMLLDDLH